MHGSSTGQIENNLYNIIVFSYYSNNLFKNVMKIGNAL